MKIFLPELDSTVRLLVDHKLPESVFRYRDNEELFANVFGPYDIFKGFQAETGRELLHSQVWVDDYHAWVDEKLKGGYSLPAGTVIGFDRYHISRSGENRINTHIVASPDLRITPKKNGGRGRGKLRLYLSLAELNMFTEVEIVDVTV